MMYSSMHAVINEIEVVRVQNYVYVTLCTLWKWICNSPVTHAAAV